MKTYYIPTSITTAAQAVAFIQEFGHGYDMEDFHLAEANDTWDRYAEGELDRPAADIRYAVESSFPSGPSVRSYWGTYEHDALPTLEAAEAACEDINKQVKKNCRALAALTLPENALESDDLDYTFSENRDGYAYKGHATVETTRDGTTYQSTYLGMSHDLDGHRLDFMRDCIQTALDNLYAHLDNWQSAEPEDEDEDSQPLILRDTYIGTSQPAFCEE